MKTLTQEHSPDMDQSHLDIERSRDVPATHPYNLQQAIERFERGYIANILELTRWDRRKTAQMLGITPEMLEAKMRDYDLLTDQMPSQVREQQDITSIVLADITVVSSIHANVCKEQ